MKIKIILSVLFLALLAAPGWAIPPIPPGLPVFLDTNCNQAQYFPLGTFCQDIDDGKIYKGMGASVEEMASATAGAGDVTGPASSSDSELPLLSGVGGKALKRSNTLTGWPYLTSGVVSALNAATMRTNLGLAIGTNVLAPNGDGSALTGLTASQLPDAAANGTTKGVATFTAADFNATTGLISIDYTNGQEAASGVKGFLTAADWATFNAKAAANQTMYIGSTAVAINRGTGALTLAGITLTTPVLGDATATTINKYTFTQPASAATLTILNNKVFTVNKSITLDVAGAGDNITATFPAASGTVGYTGTMTATKLCVADSSTPPNIVCNTDTPTGLGTITEVGDITTGAAFTSTVPGKTLRFNNISSGYIILQAQTGALGTTTVSLPSVSGTIVVGPSNVPISFVGPSVARIITLPDAAITVARTDAGQTFTGVQAFTAPTFATSIAPAVAGASTIGTTAYEWGNLYLTDSAVIYGQADQSNSLTSAATGWAANLLFTANAGFAAKQGTSGGFVDFYEPSGGGTSKFRLIAPSLAADVTWTLPTAAAGGTGYLVTVNAAGALSYTDPATFSVAAGSSSVVTVGALASGSLASGFTAVTTALGGTGLTSYTGGDTLYYASGTTLSKLAKGTAYQIKMMNSGATAPAWTSTLGATGTRLTLIYATDIETTNTPTIGGTALTAIMLPLAGGTMTGQLVTPSSGSHAANLGYWSSDSSTGGNGEIWVKSGGVYAWYGGAAHGPFGTSTATIGGTLASSATLYLTSTVASTANAVQASGIIVDGTNNLNLPTGASLQINGTSVISAGSDGTYYLQITNNTARTPDASVNQLYPEANVWKVNQNGTEYSMSLAPSGNQVNFATAMTSGGIPYASATNTLSSSGVMTQYGIILGGGAAGSPTVVTPSTTTTYALFATATSPAFRAIAVGDLPLILPSGGGTGVANNNANTITFAGGNYSFNMTLGGNTSVTFPASGTLAILGANTFTGTQTLRAGNTGANAPLYFQAATALSTAAAGAMEVSTDQNILYYTIGTGPTRYSIPLALAAAPLLFTTGGTTARTITLPDAAITVARTDAANTFTGASSTTSWAETTPVITGGLTASGSGANNFSGSTGTFLTSTGAVTIGPGAVGITGITALSFTARTSGYASYYTITPPADTGITTTQESIGENHVTATRTWADGTVALQRERFFAGPTYNKTTTSATFTDVFNMYLTPPIAGTGVTFTRGHTFGIVDSTSAASSITGGFIVATAIGTAATSVGIGGGNINAGGTVTAAGFSGPLTGAVTGAASGNPATVANVNTYMGGGVQSITETSEAATCNWANGSTCVIAGEANTTAWTLTMSNPVSGQVYRIYLTQQTGGPTPLPTFSPTVTWVNGAPTFSGTNTKHDAVTCQYVGTTYFCGLIGNNF